MARRHTCSGCGSTAFNVLDDGSVVCQHCGETAETKVRKTYNRGVKEESGHNSAWNGLASFLLFEYIGGYVFGCFAMVLVFGFVFGGMALFAWKNKSDRPVAAAKKAETPAPTDEQRQARTIQTVQQAAGCSANRA